MAQDVDTKLVKELRDATGISVMQCKNALEEAGGDMEKALAILKKTSSDVASKKAGREAKDGRVDIKQEGNKALLFGLHCETDFVSRNEDFVNLMTTLLEKAWAEGIEKMQEESKALIDPVIQKTGEKIELGEISVIEGSTLGSYVHNFKMGVVVSLIGGDENLAKDIAMHVAAMKPEYINQEEITDEVKTMMQEVFEKEVADSDKPEEIKKKILDGKMATYFKERTLVDQPFIKDSNETVGSLLNKNGATIKEVKRYSI